MRGAIVICLAACADPHVTLKAPAPNITPAERVAMFKALEPVGHETVEVSQNHGPWHLASTTLILADGTHVVVPQDLLPVVAPDSDTARAARASAAARHRVKTWLYVGIGATIASAVVLGSFVFGGSSPVPEEYLFPGAALATAVPFYAARHEHQEELQLRMQAFSTYTRDLGMRLDVCAHGLEVIACETPVTPNAPGMVAPSAPSSAPTQPAPATTQSAPATTQPAAPPPSTPPASSTQPAPAPAQSPIVDPFAPQP
jgi:hypothetical protein